MDQEKEALQSKESVESKAEHVAHAAKTAEPLKTEVVTESEKVAEAPESEVDSSVKQEKSAKQAEVTAQEPEKFEHKGPTPNCGDPDMDWDELESDVHYSREQREDMATRYEQTMSKVAEDEVVEGTVVSITKREVVVDVQHKSEGVLSVNEFRYNPNLQVGDKVEVYVESQEDRRGQLQISHKKARMLQAWERINQAYENQEVIQGYVKTRTKGGMIVDVFGIEAFLPGSQIDVRPIRDYDVYVDKTMEFKVVKINMEPRNVVVSHKALIEEELEQQRREIIAKLEKGQILEGLVKNITSYGVFVDLGGVDGLVHITDLAWARVSHPSEVVQLDEKIQVVILDYDEDKRRIALGVKQLQPHPWESLDPNLKAGDVVRGKVLLIADYGAFVELSPGIEGLVHVSEMSWNHHLRSAQEFVKVGEEIEAVILSIDREAQKISLGMKQLKPDPWKDIESRYPVESRHKGKVSKFMNFGIFVELEEGIEGLVHLNDLSWTKRIKHPAEFTQLGAEIEVVVLSADVENRRLSLGIKQLEENPWEVFESIYTLGSVHEGTVKDVFDKGAVIQLPYGVEAFCTPKQLVKSDGQKAKEDEKLDFKVIEFSKANRRIVVSHARTYEEPKREEKSAESQQGGGGGRRSSSRENADTMRRLSTPMERTTLGDLIELESEKGEEKSE